MDFIINLFHQVDHFMLVQFHKVAFLRNYVLPIWTYFTTALPFGFYILTSVSVQLFYENRERALGKNTFYVGSGVVVSEPEAVKQIILSPPKQVKKSWVFNCVPQSDMLGVLLNTAEQHPSDLNILKEMCSKGLNHMKTCEEYINSMTLDKNGDLNLMYVYEHCLFIMLFNNKLTEERRKKLIDWLLPLIFTRLSFMPWIPNNKISKFLGLHKSAESIRAEFKEEFINAHHLDINNQEEAHLIDLYVKLIILNCHAPGAKLEKIIKPALKENWSWAKDLKDLKQIFNFGMDAIRIWPSPVDINWEATEDFVLDYPNVEPLLIRKGFFLTVALRAIHFDPKLNPEPYKIKLDRDPAQNYAFNSPLNQKPKPGPRECPGRLFSEELLPLIVLKYLNLKNAAHH